VSVTDLHMDIEALRRKRDVLQAEVEKMAEEAANWRRTALEYRTTLVNLLDALHDTSANGPALVGVAEEAAIAVLARYDGATARTQPVSDL
jgi:hypothetical protein